MLALQKATPSLPLKLISPGLLVVPYSIVDPYIKLKEVLVLCNANFFFSQIVSYRSPLLNLILGIGIGVGAVALAGSFGTYDKKQK